MNLKFVSDRWHIWLKKQISHLITKDDNSTLKIAPAPSYSDHDNRILVDITALRMNCRNRSAKLREQPEEEIIIIGQKIMSCLIQGQELDN